MHSLQVCDDFINTDHVNRTLARVNYSQYTRWDPMSSVVLPKGATRPLQNETKGSKSHTRGYLRGFVLQ